MIHINFYAAARAAAGVNSESLEAKTFAEALEILQKNADLKRVLPQCSFLLNGSALKNFGQELGDGDNIDVLPRFAGG